MAENIALIGYGYWGKKLYGYLREDQNFSLSHVYFPSLQHSEPSYIRREYGEEFIPSVEDIWNDSSVPNVVVATPIDSHYSVVREALSHSKNVLVEKPFTTRADEAICAAEMASQRDLVLMTEYTYTFSRALRVAEKIIRAGQMGSLQSIHISLRQLGRFLGYDVYSLLGSHALSILDMFLSLGSCDFESVPLMHRNGILTGGLINFTSKEGRCSGCIDVSLHCPTREKKVILCCENGTLTYDQYAQYTLSSVRYCLDSNNVREDIVRERSDSHFDENHNLRHALIAFHEALHNGAADNIVRSIAVTQVLEFLGVPKYG